MRWAGFHRLELRAGKPPVIATWEDSTARGRCPFFQYLPFSLRGEVSAGFRSGRFTPIDHGALGVLNEEAPAIGRDDHQDAECRYRLSFASSISFLEKPGKPCSSQDAAFQPWTLGARGG